MSINYMTPKYLELFIYKPGTTSYLNGYWLASRCTTYNDSYIYFRISSVENGKTSAGTLYYNDNDYNSNGYSYAIRPVVEINLSKVNIGITGDGSRDNPYSIEAK